MSKHGKDNRLVLINTPVSIFRSAVMSDKWVFLKFKSVWYQLYQYCSIKKLSIYDQTEHASHERQTSSSETPLLLAACMATCKSSSSFALSWSAISRAVCIFWIWASCVSILVAISTWTSSSAYSIISILKILERVWMISFQMCCLKSYSRRPATITVKHWERLWSDLFYVASTCSNKFVQSLWDHIMYSCLWNHPYLSELVVGFTVHWKAWWDTLHTSSASICLGPYMGSFSLYI